MFFKNNGIQKVPKQYPNVIAGIYGCLFPQENMVIHWPMMSVVSRPKSWTNFWKSHSVGANSWAHSPSPLAMATLDTAFLIGDSNYSTMKFGGFRML